LALVLIVHWIGRQFEFFICLLNNIAMLGFAVRYMYCEKCFNELPDDGIDMADDPLNPGL